MKQIYLFIILGCLLTYSAAGQETDWQQMVNRKQFTAVIKQAETLTMTDSTNYATMYAIGQAYDGMLRYREAYTYFRHCFAMDSTSNDLLNALARTAVNLGRAADAEQFYQRVLVNDSTDFYANYQLARLYQQTGDYEKALDKFEDMLIQYPEHVAILRNIGDIQTILGNTGDAQLVYSMAYKRNKENVNLAHTLINTMLRNASLLTEYAVEALAVCDTALYYNPDNILIRRDKAMAYFMNRKYTEADSLYTGLLADGDSTYMTIKYSGSSKYYGGMYLDAIEPLELAYSMDTTAVDVNILLGAALGRTYDRKRAHELFDQAEKLMQPTEILTTLLTQSRAETYSREGRFQEATRLYYELWKKNERPDYLASITFQAYQNDVSKYQSPESRQRGLFLTFLYINKYIEKGNNPKWLFRYHSLLTSLYEDMFFRNATEEPLLAPDGKKSTINVIEVRRLLNLLPEQEITQAEHEELLKEERRKTDRSVDGE